MEPGTSWPPSTTSPSAGSAEKYIGRSAMSGRSERTWNEMLTGVGTDFDVRYSLRLIVTRDEAGADPVSVVMLTATPASLAAWNTRLAVVALAAVFCSVTYSTKPGLTVPSAKLVTVL